MNAPLATLIDAALERARQQHDLALTRIRAAIRAYRERQITYDELRQVLR